MFIHGLLAAETHCHLLRWHVACLQVGEAVLLGNGCQLNECSVGQFCKSCSEIAVSRPSCVTAYIICVEMPPPWKLTLYVIKSLHVFSCCCCCFVFQKNIYVTQYSIDSCFFLQMPLVTFNIVYRQKIDQCCVLKITVVVHWVIFPSTILSSYIIAVLHWYQFIESCRKSHTYSCTYSLSTFQKYPSQSPHKKVFKEKKKNSVLLQNAIRNEGNLLCLQYSCDIVTILCIQEKNPLIFSDLIHIFIMASQLTQEIGFCKKYNPQLFSKF